MIPHAYFILVTLVASICPLAGAAQQSPVPEPQGAAEQESLANKSLEDKSLEAKVDRFLEPYMETGNFSGSVLLAPMGILSAWGAVKGGVHASVVGGSVSFTREAGDTGRVSGRGSRFVAP